MAWNPLGIRHRAGKMHPRPWVFYGLALLLPVLTILVVQATRQGFAVAATAFAMQILICAFFGGAGPGLLCTVAAALLADYYLFTPPHSFDILGVREQMELGFLLAAGALLSLLGFVLRDFLRRRSTEQALEQTEIRFRQIAETVDEVFWLSTPDASAILYVSPGFEKIWGHTCEALYANPALWSAGIHPSDLPLVRKSLLDLAQGREYDIDFRISRPDGSERWINDRGYVRRGADGTVILTSGIATDITQRRQAEEALHAGERRFASIVTSAMDGIIGIDDTQRITLVNFAAERIFGCAATRMVGRPLVDFLPRRFRENHPAYVEAFGSSGETQREMGRLGVVYGLRPDGTEFPIEASISQVDVDGRKQYTAIFRDVTQRIESERRIGRLTRLYSVLSGINSAIVRIHDRQKLFEEACRILTELGEFPTAWIGLVDGGTQKVMPQAWYGPEQDRDLVFDVEFSTRAESPGGTSTVGRAIRDRRAVFNNNLFHEPSRSPVMERLVERGYRSIIALPLGDKGTCVGVLAIHSRERDAFDEQEMKLLDELAGDITFALTYIAREEDLNYLAFHEPLTGLANRVTLHRRLTEITAGAESRLPFAVLLMNIDNFRDINDTLGHKNGDVLLHAIARRISETLWQSDVVACLGGDEFAVLLPHLAATMDIDLVIRKMEDSLQKSFTIQGLPISIEASMGVALYPEHGTTADMLWQHADVALRKAKETHQAYLLYSPAIDDYDPAKLTLLGDLREAIDQNHLILHFQPTVDLRRNTVAGVEALVRWQHPSRGLLFPDSFIPLVEHTGLIDPLSSWVLASALRQADAWRRSGLRLDLSVNLSARNLQNPDLNSEVLDLARSVAFPLECLTLEVTESAIMTDPARAARQLHELSEKGVRISMDDFGIGQSSLSYLKDLPISRMKIDKSFIREFRKPKNAAIARSAIELGRNLGISVTAEGVEDRTTCDALCKLGCEYAQGYYFSKPQPADRLTAWLRESPWGCPAS